MKLCAQKLQVHLEHDITRVVFAGRGRAAGDMSWSLHFEVLHEMAFLC